MTKAPTLAASDATHPCGAARCGTAIPATAFMCGPHTDLLAPPLRHAVRDTYEPGQTPAVNRYLTAAIDAVAHIERRAKPAREHRKAIQLSLFDI